MVVVSKEKVDVRAYHEFWMLFMVHITEEGTTPFIITNNTVVVDWMQEIDTPEVLLEHEKPLLKAIREGKVTIIREPDV